MTPPEKFIGLLKKKKVGEKSDASGNTERGNGALSSTQAIGWKLAQSIIHAYSMFLCRTFPRPAGRSTSLSIFAVVQMSSFVFARPLTKYGRARPVVIGRGRSQSVRL